MKQRWLRALFRRRVLTIMLILLQVCFIIYLVISGSQLSQRISRLLTIISVAAVLYIVSKRDKGAYKTAWAILILTIPLFGGLMYLLFNFQSSTKRFEKAIQESQQKAKPMYALLGNDYPAAVGQFPQYTTQLRYLQDFADFPVYVGTATRYLTPGEQKWETLLTELKKAEKYIFLEYFIVQEGKMWNSILEILRQKAAMGVLVRLIYDDMGCFLTLPKDYPATLMADGIQCAVFNPFRPLLTVKQNNRDHHKIAVIDGKVAFTGGINLADEYINAIEKHGHWKDAAVMVSGKAAWSFTLMFLQMWELCTHHSENYADFYPWSKTDGFPVARGFVQPYADSPMDTENVGEHVYLQILSNAKQYVYINTPYLIVDDSMLSALCLAAKSGVDVRIVTPHRWDKWLVHMTTRSYYRDLIRAGVKVYEYTKGFIHSKTFVSDDQIATVGTTHVKEEVMFDDEEKCRKLSKWIIGIFTICILIFLAIRHVDKVANAVVWLTNLVKPLLYGIILALFLNVPLGVIEKNLFRKHLTPQKQKLRRPMAILLSIVLVMGILVGIAFLVIPELADALQIVVTSLMDSMDRLGEMESTANYSKIPFGKQLSQINIDFAQLKNNLWMTQLGTVMLDSAVRGLGSVASTTVDLVIALVFSIYVLANKETLKRQINRLIHVWLPQKWGKIIVHIASVCGKNFKLFVAGQTTEAIILGSLCAIGMLILKIPYAPTVGALVGVTALIPYVGAWFSVIVGAFMILTVSPFKAFVFVAFLLTLQQVEGNAIYPKVVGAKINLPAMWVLAAITIGGNMAGPVGMLLGVPTASTLYTLLKEATSEREQTLISATKVIE